MVDTEKQKTDLFKSRYRGAVKKPREQAAEVAATHVTPSRVKAHACLCEIRKRDAYAQELIDTMIEQSDLSGEDKAFAARLVLGVVSSKGTLDEALDNLLTRPDTLHEDLREALRISAYELIFLKKNPHAAVDQGVELAKSVFSWSAGLANAVLRKLAERAGSFPFGDPKTDDAAFARQYAFPLWLSNKLISDMGRESAEAFMESSNRKADIYFAINYIKSSIDEVESRLEAAEVSVQLFEAADAPRLRCYRLNSSKDVASEGIQSLLAEGKIIISDYASQLVVQTVLPASLPSSFLEIGAGRGTKTVLLQSAMQEKYGALPNLYYTLDKHAFKMNLLMERSHAYGLKLSEVLLGDALLLDSAVPGELFDFIFVDAPCSGLGTLRRHPEIRWRITQREIEDMAALQLAMLKQAAKHVRLDGTLAYSTCSFTKEENSGVIEAFISSEEGRDFGISSIAGRSIFSTLRSPHPSDVHFAAKFQRIR